MAYIAVIGHERISKFLEKNRYNQVPSGKVTTRGLYPERYKKSLQQGTYPQHLYQKLLFPLQIRSITSLRHYAHINRYGTQFEILQGYAIPVDEKTAVMLKMNDGILSDDPDVGRVIAIYDFSKDDNDVICDLVEKYYITFNNVRLGNLIKNTSKSFSSINTDNIVYPKRILDVMQELAEFSDGKQILGPNELTKIRNKIEFFIQSKRIFSLESKSVGK